MDNPFTQMKFSTTGEARGAASGIQIAPISYVDEASGLVKVALPSSGGKSESPFLWRTTVANNLTFPRYVVGDTLVYGYIDNNPNLGVQLGIVQNAVNPPGELDKLSYYLGASSIVVSESAIELKVGSCTLKLTSEGLELIGATEFKVNGQSVATVGAVDSDGEHLVSKGW